MKKEFVSYEIALKLKELDFDEDCLAIYYDNGEEDSESDWRLLIEKPKKSFKNDKEFEISAPLWQQVIDWFRNVHKIHISIIPFNDEEGGQILYEFVIYEFDWNDISDYTYYHSNGEAREQAILKGIEIIKKQDNAN